MIATDLSAAQSRKLGLRRIFATAIGGICGAALSQFLGPGSGAADPWLYGTQRFIETVLGVVIAWGISFLPRLVNADQA